MQFSFTPFPVSIFPESLANYIKNVAEAMVCPPDFVGTLLLATLSSAIGTARVVKVKDGWHEPPVLYAAIVAPPSSKKSPVFKEVLRPVKEKQRVLFSHYQAEKDKYQQELDVWEGADTKQRGPKPEKPIPPRNYLSDFTFEALAKLLSNNPKGLLLGLDELAAWVNSMDQYRSSKGADKDHWLSLWSCGMITVDRASKDEPIIILQPFVTVVGGIQPDRLKVFKSKEHDGFIDRILFAFPEEVANQWTDETVSESLRNHYSNLYNQLYTLEPQCTPEGGTIPVALPFSIAGRKAFILVVNQNNIDIQLTANPFLKSAFSKLEAYFFRFALILQLCGNPGSHQIEEDAVQGALLLLEYFKGQVRKVYAQIAGEAMSNRILRSVEAIRSNGNNMTLRDCYTKKIAGVKDAKAAKKLFTELEKEGNGKIIEQKNTSGGRPTIVFHLRQCDCVNCNQQSTLRKFN